MRFTENNLIIPLISGVTAVTSGIEFDSFNMKGYDHATLMFQFSTNIASSSGSLTLECGSADSADSADASFFYRVNETSAAKAASYDKLSSTWSTGSVVAISSTTYAGHWLIVELDAENLPCASKQYEWVTATMDNGCTAGAVEMAIAILSNPRYSDNVMPTALA